MTSRATCASCRWWLRHEPFHVYGDCRRFPPLNTLSVSGREVMGGRVEVSMVSHPQASWPNTHESDWCGEHAPREEEDKP